jgi:site-specific recombinase XerD
MRETGADMHTITLEKGLATFLNALSGKNRSAATLRAYKTDIAQFIAFLHANNVSIQKPADVEKIDVMEYLSSSPFAQSISHFLNFKLPIERSS